VRTEILEFLKASDLTFIRSIPLLIRFIF